jgi:hypothetical protein
MPYRQVNCMVHEMVETFVIGLRDHIDPPDVEPMP